MRVGQSLYRLPSFGGSQASLSSNQLAVNALAQNFSSQAGNFHNLSAMSLASLTFSSLRLLSRPLGNALSATLALVGEVAVFRGTNQILNDEAESWHERNGFTATFLDFALLKGFSYFFKNQNFMARHAVSGAAMVAGEYSREAAHFSEVRAQSFSNRFTHAFVSSLALEAGGALAARATGGRLRTLERSFHSQFSLSAHTLSKSSFIREVIGLRMFFPPSVLRDYQEEANASVRTRVRQGGDRALVVLPTGTGKTVTMAHQIASFLKGEFRPPKGNRDRVLVVSHREEILVQNAQKIGGVVGENEVGLYQAGSRDIHGKEISSSVLQNKKVVVASIQSLLQNGIDLDSFGLIVLDEAHHYVHGNEWFAPLQKLGFFDSLGNICHHPERILVGFTATPDRLSGKPLNTTFGLDGLVAEKDISWMVDPSRRYLLLPYGIAVNFEVQGVTDASEAIKLVSAQEKANVIAEIFHNRFRHHGDKFYRMMVFVEPRQSREELSEVEVVTRHLNKEGIRAAGISDETVWMPDPSDAKKTIIIRGNADRVKQARREVIAASKLGVYDAIVNVNIGTEGYDDPGIEGVIIARALGSRSLFAQIVGRALRPDPAHLDREQAFAVDLGGNLERHNIGAKVRELYGITPTGKLTPIGGGGGGAGGNIKVKVPIESVNVLDKGGLVAVRKSETHYLSEALRPYEPETLQKAAYRLGIHSDRLFAYQRGEKVPRSWEEVERIGRTLQDMQQKLLEAWAKDRVEEMDAEEPLTIDLAVQIRDLNRNLRVALYRWGRGSKEYVGRSDSVIRIFLERGELRDDNKGSISTENTTLRDYYDDLENKIVGLEESRRPEVRELIRKAIHAQRGWEPHANPEIDALLTAFRDVVIDQYGGEIPKSGNGYLSPFSPLRVFLQKGELYKSSSGTLSLRDFYNDLEDRLIGSEEARRPEVRELIRKAIYAQRGWEPHANPEVDALLTAFRNAVIDQYGGEIPEKKANIFRKSFLQNGELPRKNMGRLSLRDFYDDLENQLTGSEETRRPRIRELIRKAIYAQRGWETHANPEIEALLTAFRNAVIDQYGGEIPEKEANNLQKPFLQNGELPRKNTGKLFLRDFYDDLENKIVGSVEARRPEVRKLIRKAIYAQRGWETHANPEVDALLTAFRNAVIDKHGGEVPEKGAGSLNYKSPLRLFFQNGEWPNYVGPYIRFRESFTRDIEQFLQSLEVNASHTRALIQSAIVSVGWN